ncbi:hypothetical protein ACFC34_41840 [Streptomyces sp. NPDC056053]
MPYGTEGLPAAMQSAREAGMNALNSIESYQEGGDELGALGLWFWLRNQAEMRLMAGFGRQRMAETPWDQVAQALQAHEPAPLERWGGVGPVLQEASPRE